MTDPKAAGWLHSLNAGSPRWAPVLRNLHAQAPDRRSAAHWALRLGAAEPDCPELVDALRHWLFDDPTPWSGPRDWAGPDDEGHIVGGTAALLDQALAMDDEWVIEGLVRLWRDGLTRPWLGHDGHKQPEAVDGWWYDNSGFTAMPSQVRTLVDRLIACGRADVVVAAWPAPSAPETAPGRGGPSASRAELLRQWLDQVVPRHAPDNVLRGRLADWFAEPGHRPFPEVEAWELFDRGSPEVEDGALTLAQGLRPPGFAMLARTAPHKVMRAAEERLRQGGDLRYLAWQLLAETTEPGGEAPAVAMAARRWILADPAALPPTSTQEHSVETAPAGPESGGPDQD